MITRLAALLMLAACGSPDYFLLPPPQPVGRIAAPASSIVVAEIGLPTYAEAVEIAVLQPDGSLRLDSSDNWADTPRRALTRHLVASLDARLTASVSAEPWPGFDSPALRLEVHTDRLVGAPDAGVEFSGQYVIITPRDGNIYATDRFTIRIPSQGPGFLGLAAAHARAIEALADQVAARVTGRRLGTS